MAEAAPGGPAPKKYGLKPREFERVNAPRGTLGHSAAHDVYAIRQELRAREQASGLDEIAPRPPRVSRRKRDYWLLMAVGNALLVTLMLLSGNVVTLVFAGAGIVIYSLGVTWVMWQIMGDY
jgi:hypothetical protein